MLGNRRWSLTLAAPLLVLAGLFAMHGLGDHSSQHSVVDSAMVMSEHGATSAPTHPVASDPAPGTDHETSGLLAELCVAVLLGGGLVAWLLLATTRRGTSWQVPRQVRACVPVPRSRAPDPPSPAVLSVYRC